MQTIVTLEHRFAQTPDGAVWTPTTNAYDFWTRYLDVFDGVKVAARVRRVSRPEDRWARADGPGVRFIAIPHYIGPYQYLLRWPWIRQTLRHAVASQDAVIMRVASALANCLEPALWKSGHPYGLEVVADPYDVFSPGAVRHPLRPFLRRWMPGKLRLQCERAVGVAYVTRQALQNRYPCRAFMVGVSDVTVPAASIVQRNRVLATHYSSICLRQSDLSTSRVARDSSRSPLTLICVGGMQELYKAQDVLVRAVAQCAQQGDNLRLVLIGEGKYRPMLEKMAGQLGIRHLCDFKGQIPAGDAVVAELDSADVFVLPSRQEGIPRAMVEAMARGLPCVGSTVGGIPELLPAEDMVAPNDVAGLAAKLHEVLNSLDRRDEMSRRSLAVATDYAEDKLRARRIMFYRHVAARTEAWLRGAAVAGTSAMAEQNDYA
jgi:glycosyltransferase involved in cell wall biosynthesis